jgi:hypothetical protein
MSTSCRSPHIDRVSFPAGRIGMRSGPAPHYPSPRGRFRAPTRCSLSAVAFTGRFQGCCSAGLETVACSESGLLALGRNSASRIADAVEGFLKEVWDAGGWDHQRTKVRNHRVAGCDWK